VLERGRALVLHRSPVQEEQVPERAPFGLRVGLSPDPLGATLERAQVPERGVPDRPVREEVAQPAPEREQEQWVQLNEEQGQWVSMTFRAAMTTLIPASANPDQSAARGGVARDAPHDDPHRSEAHHDGHG
jgi:hypothetical protein